jgi:hypothetical protein
MLKKKFRRNYGNCILRARIIFLCITYLAINILVKQQLLFYYFQNLLLNKNYFPMLFKSFAISGF